MKIWFIVPARKGSKGFPFKNRKLVPILIDSLAKEKLETTIVTSDDDYIQEFASMTNCLVHKRSEFLSCDSTNIKDVIIDVINKYQIADKDVCVVLYPTYPQRTDDHINNAIEFLKINKLSSMLCRKKCSYPIPLILKDEGNNAGSIVSDKLYYRRQDWPKYFELCHFVSCFKASEVHRLNNQLFNNKTGWMWLKDNPIDVDSKKDYECFLGMENE